MSNVCFHVAKFPKFHLISPLNILVNMFDYLLNNGVFSQNNVEKQFKISQTRGDDMQFFLSCSINNNINTVIRAPIAQSI
jgi:hypothetical protein